MPALVLTRSSRLMPGFRAMPAVTMKSSESGRRVVAVGADDPGVEALDRGRLPLVEALALRHAVDDIHHHDGARQILLGDALGRGGADVACADDGDLVEHRCGARCRLAPAAPGRPRPSHGAGKLLRAHVAAKPRSMNGPRRRMESAPWAFHGPAPGNQGPSGSQLVPSFRAAHSSAGIGIRLGTAPLGTRIGIPASRP